MTVRAMGKGDNKKKNDEKKETPAAKRAREKEEKEQRLAREKEEREELAAQRRGANARAAEAAGAKEPKEKKEEKPASASDEDDDDDGDEGEGEEAEEDDDEEGGDLAVGDPSCKAHQCGLGSASAKWNCARHRKAAREQAANVDTDAAQARRERKERNGGESTSTGGPAPKKKKNKHAKDRPVFDAKAAEQAVANAMAPFMQQFHALAAQQVSPVLTGYIRLDRLHLWQVTGGRAAAGAVASTSTGRARPRIESRTIEASLAAAEEAAKRIESKRKQAANKAQKLWRNALTIQFAKLHGCSNLALKMYDRHVCMTTLVKRSIHLSLAPHGITMSRVRLRACWLRLYPFIRFVRIRSRV